MCPSKSQHKGKRLGQHVFLSGSLLCCTSTLSFLTSHDTLIPSPAPPCSVNTLHCYGLSETMEVGQRAEGCGWMPQHKPVEKKKKVCSHFPSVFFEKKREQPGVTHDTTLYSASVSVGNSKGNAGPIDWPYSSWFTEVGDVNVSYIFSFGGMSSLQWARIPRGSGFTQAFPLHFLSK